MIPEHSWFSLLVTQKLLWMARKCSEIIPEQFQILLIPAPSVNVKSVNFLDGQNKNGKFHERQITARTVRHLISNLWCDK